MYKLLTVLVVVIMAIIILWYINRKEEKIEGFWDILPYGLTWNIHKCKDLDCIKDESYKCYKWCNKWPEEGARNNCRQRCLDYADSMSIQTRFNDYTWGRTKTKFDEFSLLNDNEFF